MDEPLHATTSRRFKDVERSFDVGSDVAAGRYVRVRNANQRRQMEHAGMAIDVALDKLAVLDISRHDSQCRSRLRRTKREVSIIVPRIVVYECGDHGSTRDQRFAEMTADEAGGSRYEYFRTQPV